MKELKNKYFLFAILLFLVFRLLFILKLPIFNDEAIFIDWGARIVGGRTDLFYTLYDGTPPGLLVVFGLFGKLLGHPLLAGRIVSTIFGLLSLIGTYKLGLLVFDRGKALLASIIYAITPLFVFFDRQALMESALFAVGLWAFYFFIKGIKEENTTPLFLSGLIIGLGFWIKVSALIYFIVTIFFLATDLFLKKKKRETAILRIFYFTLPFVVIFSFLMLQNGASIIFTRGNRYSLTLQELLRFPFNNWAKNTISFLRTIVFYLSPVNFVLLILSIRIFLKGKDKVQKIFLRYTFLIFLFLIFIARSLNSRYLMPALISVPLVAAYSLDVYFSKRKSFVYLSLGFMILQVVVFVISPFSYLSFFQKYLKDRELGGYIYGDTSGYGVNEAKAYIREKVSGPTLVGARLDSGNPESAMMAYFGEGKEKIYATYIDSRLFNGTPESFIASLNFPGEIYFVSRSANFAGLDTVLVEEKRFYKPDGKSYVGVYRIKKE